MSATSGDYVRVTDDADNISSRPEAVYDGKTAFN